MSSTIERRVAVVTGASAGIGKAAAKALLEKGWRVIGVGRNPARSEEAANELRAVVPGAEFEMLVADLAELSQAKRVARQIKDRTGRIDVLLNNAGGIGKELVVTSEGNEAIFTGNHVGPFVLTMELLDVLKATAEKGPAGAVRIINTSSSAVELSPGLDWDNLQMLREHRASLAYCNVKLANVMFTRSLGRKLDDDGILVKAVHPGVVATNFSSYGDDELQSIAATMKDVEVSAEQGADNLVWLSTEQAIPDAPFFYNRAPYAVPPFALDDENCARLWTETEAIIARAGI